MRFHLNHTPLNPGFHLSHQDQIFLIGSCFSDNIGNLLSLHQFDIFSNPNGIVFNPLSISRCLNSILKREETDVKSILQRDKMFYSYLHHSGIHADSAKALEERIQKTNAQAFLFLKSASYLVITFGSAYYYYHKNLQTAVANCHKQPGSVFEKRLLSASDIVSAYNSMIKNLQKLNPGLKIIFTVSPVKYLKDGLIENNLSKSTLILATHELIKNNSNCFYFPAFELLNDDLRDYRFYKEDLAHPNDQAIKYIWEKFSECYFSEATRALNHNISELNTAQNHRKMLENKGETDKLDDFIARKKAEIRNLFSQPENQKKN